MKALRLQQRKDQVRLVKSRVNLVKCTQDQERFQHRAVAHERGQRAPRRQPDISCLVDALYNGLCTLGFDSASLARLRKRAMPELGNVPMAS